MALASVFALALTAAAAGFQEDWKDTHRVHLRNGNFIDGRLERISDDHILFRWNSTAVMRIRLIDIRPDGIEEIKIRTVGARPRTVQVPTGNDRPPDTGEKPPDGAAPTPPPPGMAAAIDAILAAYPKSPENQRAGLIGRIRSFGIEGARYIISAIPRLDDAKAGIAMIVLGQLQDLRIEPEVRSLLKSEKPVVRQEACMLLAARKDEGAVPALMPLLKDPDAGVRAAAIEAVGRSANESRVGDLVIAIRDSDSRVRSKAIYFSKVLASRHEAEPDLVRAWQSLLAHGSAEVKAELAPAFGRLAGMPSSPEVPSADMARELMSLLGDRSEIVRAGAAAGIGETREHGQKLAVEIIGVLEIERVPAVEAAICEALGTLIAPQAVDILIAKLESGADAVKDAAVRSLRKITRQPFDLDVEKWREWKSGANQ